MTMNELFVSSLKQNLDMIKMHLADLSDADLLVRPVPGANHANWQIGHLIVSETHMVNTNGGKSAELPAGFADRYTKEAAKIDDASRFAPKADLLAQLERVRAASITWAQSLTSQQLDAPSSFPQLCPTIAHMANLVVGHGLMHIGQIQVLRRKLGKPILF